MDSQKEQISIITLNLRFGLADDGLNKWENREKGFPSFFNKYRADFIGVQEANDFQIDFISNILTEYNFIGKRKPAPSFWQNNIIFYKKTWECSYYKHFFLSPTPTIPSRIRESRWPRQCTIGMFNNNDSKVICINTHFDFEEAVQVKSAKIIMEQLSYLPSELPAFLIGDFNSTPLNPCHKIFIGQNKNLNVKGPYFKNAFSEPFIGTHHGFKGDLTGDHIDWILYRGEIIPIDSKVIQDKFEDLYISDHFPLYATFSLKE